MEVGALGLTQFQDYREFLRALFADKRRLNARFSFRKFSVVVGFKSPNYLQMILDGRRNLTPSTAATIANRLKLSAAEQAYFVALVKRDAAENDHERNLAERERLGALKRIVAKDIPNAQKEVFGKWFYLLVRELFLLKGASADPAWLSARLGGAISETEAANAVELLVRLGFLVVSDSGYKPAEPVLDTNDQQMQAALMREFHSGLLRMWAQNLDRLGPREQELGVLNIPLDSRKIPELRRRIRQFQDEIIGFVQDESNADCVVQLGTYLMPFPKDESR